MSDIKWIKVAVDMFEDSKIEFIRSLPEGDAIIVTWIQMLSIAGQSNMGGYLMVAEGIPYTEQLLSNKLRRQPVLLQFAIETLTRLKMINVEDGPYHITKWEKHQNVEGMERVRLKTNERVKKHRSKEKEKLETLPSNATVTLQVTQCNATELELELELDKKKKIKKEIKDAKIKYAEYVSLLPEEYDKLLQEYGEDMTKECIDILNTYKGSTGKTYKSDYMTMTPKSWVPKRYLEEQSKKVTVINGGFKVKPSVTSKIQEMYQKALEDERREANGGY